MTVLEDTRPLARKEHRCDICRGVIAAGDTYHRQRGVWEEGPYTFKAHALCDAAYWKAHHDADCLYDEAPDLTDEVMPLVRWFFVALVLFPSTGAE